MASPRELAEKAFALLQNAISESEARATEIDEQLKRKRAPKTRTEEQNDVLAHRLESVEAERLRWEQQAGHLEEIAEAERVKVAQLKKKLEIAESGPDKLTKKEVNFWRAKAETIDAQIKEYQERLTALRRELDERDALIEKLKASPGSARDATESTPPEADPRPESDESVNELRRQLDQRDAWLAELRLELHELRAEPAPPLETQAEVETLRSQITSLERSLTESHNLRAAAQGDLMRAEHEIAARERAVREGHAATERIKTTLAEREHRIAELSAEIETLRNELRQRHELDRQDTTGYEEQIAALTREAEELRQRIEQDRHDNGAARAALEIALHEREQELEKQRQLAEANERDFGDLRRQLAEREQAAHDLARQLAEREQVAHDLRHRIEEQRDEVGARERKLEDCQQQLRELTQTLAERDERASAAAADLEQVRATLTAKGEELEGLRESAAASRREIDELRSTLAEAEARAADAEARLAEAQARAADAQAQAEAAARDMESAREQLAGLEAELKEERENAESLGELANERREHMTKLQEQVEEAEERYADANWRLGKSLYFERIVKRRKGLIKKLLDALRAKMKANVALKAGVDGLRTYKQTADMNQHKLLQRIDGLKAELQEAQETIKRHEAGTIANEELATAETRATELEERLNTQAELIQSLEADLKAARLSQKAAEAKVAEAKGGEAKAAEAKATEAKAGKSEVERLTKELEAKNQTIAELQVYADEQQKKLAKLRHSESETIRLKAVNEKERGEIEALQAEVAQLRKALEGAAEKASAELRAKISGLEGKLKERDGSIARLMATIKEHETTIKKLTESGESWKRKYQFLAADQPDNHNTGAAEK
jgi:chromosome segregation ATPase